MELTAAAIEGMSYVQFISLIRETNRCPGGKESIRKILSLAHVDRQSSILEVGSNTGFTSLEIARTLGCVVHGIDVIPEAVAESQRVLALDTEDVRSRTKFSVGSAYTIPFDEGRFDLVVAGGATSFMDDKRRALTEYHRVLRPWGLLSITNLYYERTPPASVVRAVSDVIGVEIKPWSYDDWTSVLSKSELFETYHIERTYIGAQSSESIDRYVAYFMSKPHICAMPTDVQRAIERRWRATIDVFNENHEYLGFLLALFRKRHVEEEPELFVPQVQRA